MTLLSRFLMAVLRRPSVTTTAIVMTPRTTAYSAIVWPASSLTSAWRPRMKSDMYSPPPGDRGRRQGQGHMPLPSHNSPLAEIQQDPGWKDHPFGGARPP